MNKLATIPSGNVIGGRYTIIRPIDAGGAGQVYLVRQQDLDLERALKVIRPDHIGDDSYRDALRHEILILSQLTHQHVVKIIDAGDDAILDASYLVMEYVAGTHLDVAAQAIGSFDALIALLSEVFQGLEYLHERKVLHGDLKPSNILVESDPITSQRHAKIADLGAAKNLSRRIAAPNELVLTYETTELTRVFGTRKYAPPELQRDLNTNPLSHDELVSLFPYVDLYCLGATMAEALSTEKIKKNIRDEAVHLLSHPIPSVAAHPTQYHYIKGLIQRLLCLNNDRDAFTSIHEAHEAFLRLDATRSLPLRVPELTDVGSTSSIRLSEGMHYFSRRAYAVVSHPAFQRLQKLNQLCFVDLFYPSARHSRFSHCLEVFSLAKKAVMYLLRDTTFRLYVTPEDISQFLAAALLHDIGHFPLAHVLEDIPEVKLDFELVGYFLNKDTACSNRTLAQLLINDWGIEADCIQSLVDPARRDRLSTGGRFFQQLLCGPLDIDKMAYVQQDSAFTGVPYGRGVDADYLLAAFVALSPKDYSPTVDDISLGIDSKGVTSASGLISARAALYGRVYWHHTNRAIMAMIGYVARRVFGSGDVTFQRYIDDTWHHSDYEALAYLVNKLPQTGEVTPTANPALGICDGSRQIYKRLVSYSHHRGEASIRDVYHKLLKLDDREREEKRQNIRMCLADILHVGIVHDHEVLIDVPKVSREQDAISNVLVVDRYSKSKLTPINQVSHVVEPLYHEFTENVKKARVFVSPHLRSLLKERDKEAAAVAEVHKILASR